VIPPLDIRREVEGGVLIQQNYAATRYPLNATTLFAENIGTLLSLIQAQASVEQSEQLREDSLGHTPDHVAFMMKRARGQLDPARVHGRVAPRAILS
jgi:hypothetical protein